MKKIAKKFNITDLKIDKKMFNPVYFEHMNDLYSTRYNIIYGGRQSGKTYAICDLLILKGMKEQRRMLFMVKQSARVEGSIWALTLKSLEKFKLLEYCTINISTKTITLPHTGTVIKMTGLDDFSKAKLWFDLSDIWLDEATSFVEKEIDTLDGTLRGKYKYPKAMYLSFNPISKNNFVYRKYGFDTGIIPPDTFILKTTYLDNRWVDPKEVERLNRLKETNPVDYAIEALGNFHSLSKNIFNNWKVEKLNPEELLKSNPDLITLNGIDFGFNHPMACILSLYDSEKKILYVIEEIYKRGLTNADIARLVKEKGWHKNVIIADCAEPKSIKELKELGLKIKPCKKGAGSILSGIKRLQDLDIRISETCENTINEFETYVWAKDKNDEYLETPEYGNDDCIDSIRYSLQGARRPPKIIHTRFF